ncbi:MAG: YHS domain-containing (seleno)protein [Bosea sp. (in: a-proteobacteria)]|uniref:YHS domain-containing (seleno)protein n=1 Tax=Bosea sp. (in: a-proteobacteria) TaxID=1871050 RepID=UPI002734EA03|nr:YHS domain-containing (seleno)protein [Bosea sp. (in: a-proteobacteria)]MDP3258081.1 YHS domain-containing (seleno)protein [Bosea sp. (in: a-proteobacteria)]MDP3319892.1 YHS domain-containing (seleno)protein [Bosea sp. (in: a-proteobacteria)]
MSSDVTLPATTQPAGRRLAGALVALVAGLLAVMLVPGVAIAPAMAGKPVNTLGSPEGVAIRGYDPVAYFRDGGPRKGSAAHALRHDGATWHFASAANRALFLADPERYKPAYGGFCAYGTSRGYLVKIEPEAWSIVEGRLYLNYDLDVRATWSMDTKTYLARSERNWPNLTARDIR